MKAKQDKVISPPLSRNSSSRTSKRAKPYTYSQKTSLKKLKSNIKSQKAEIQHLESKHARVLDQMYTSKRSSVSSSTPKASIGSKNNVSRSTKGEGRNAAAITGHTRKVSRSIRFADEVPEETTINHVSPFESLDEEDNYNLEMIRGSNTPSLTTRKTHTTNRDSLKGGERSVSALLSKDKENLQSSLYDGLLTDGQKNVAESKRWMIKQTQEDLKTALQDLENVQKEERRQLKQRLERI